MKKVILTILFSSFAVLIIFNSQINQSVYSSVIFCSKVVIPALFPTTLLSTVISTYISENFSAKNKLILGFILSLIGGYISGAVFLKKLVDNKELDSKTAMMISPYFVSCGPAVAIILTGIYKFKSIYIGLFIYLVQVFVSVIVFFIFKIQKQPIYIKNNIKRSDCFTCFCNSAEKTSSAMITISSFVIIFGIVKDTVSLISKNLSEQIIPLLEVTNGITLTDNIYKISFILAFAGISVHFQIISILNIKSRYCFNFFKIRLLCGILTAFVTKSVFVIFKIPLSVVAEYSFSFSDNSLLTTITLGLTMIVLIFTLLQKNVAKQ